MKLNNYLLQLYNSEMSKEYSIRLSDQEKCICEVLGDIWAVKGHGHIKYVIESLDVQRRTLDNWRWGISPIPIAYFAEILLIWKSICSKSDMEISNRLDHIFKKTKYFSVARGKRVKLPRIIDSKLAYLLGFLLGDGCIKERTESLYGGKSNDYPISFAINDFRFGKKIVCPYFQGIFGTNIPMYKLKNYNCFEATTSSKVIYIFLNQVFEIPTGKKKGKLKIPTLINSSSRVIKTHFVAGFFDADGNIYVKNKEISITQADKRFLTQLSSLLETLGIQTRRIYTTNKELGTTYYLSIRRNSNSLFLRRIPFRSTHHLKKKKALLSNFVEK